MLLKKKDGASQPAYMQPRALDTSGCVMGAGEGSVRWKEKTEIGGFFKRIIGQNTGNRWVSRVLPREKSSKRTPALLFGRFSMKHKQLCFAYAKSLDLKTMWKHAALKGEG